MQFARDALPDIQGKCIRLDRAEHQELKRVDPFQLPGFRQPPEERRIGKVERLIASAQERQKGVQFGVHAVPEEHGGIFNRHLKYILITSRNGRGAGDCEFRLDFKFMPAGSQQRGIRRSELELFDRSIRVEPDFCGALPVDQKFRFQGSAFFIGNAGKKGGCRKNRRLF